MLCEIAFWHLSSQAPESFCLHRLPPSTNRLFKSAAAILTATLRVIVCDRTYRHYLQSARMHSVDYTPSANSIAASSAIGIGAHTLGSSGSRGTAIPLSVQFSPEQCPPANRKLDVLFREKFERKEYFYGVEVAARSYNQPTELDYRDFGAVLPLFTAIVWLGGEYWNVEPIEEVEAVRLAHKIKPHTTVLPHFTWFRADEGRVADMMAQNFSNVLALRGDQVHRSQEYEYATDLVKLIRQLRGDTISIGVAGYPDTHPTAKSLDEDMDNLQKKIDAGGDFIITQLCFSARTVKEFVSRCRERGIKVPIIIGIFVPETMQTLTGMMRVTQVPMAPEELARYEALKDEPKQFEDLAIQNAIEMVTELYDSGLDIYGVQFFSMNKFANLQRIVAKLTPKYFSTSADGNKINEND